MSLDGLRKAYAEPFVEAAVLPGNLFLLSHTHSTAHAQPARAQAGRVVDCCMRRHGRLTWGWGTLQAQGPSPIVWRWMMQCPSERTGTHARMHARGAWPHLAGITPIRLLCCGLGWTGLDLSSPPYTCVHLHPSSLACTRGGLLDQGRVGSRER